MSELLEGRDVPLGRFATVRRTLPHRSRRTIGAWCFVDAFGPDELSADPAHRGLHVPPHPHCGLQTVTWLLAGEVLHRDSIGSVATIVPGQLNLMTSGHGIAHSEHSPPQVTTLHGLQLWVALPDAARETAAAFEHHDGLPVWTDERSGSTARVLLGEVDGVRSPATTYSPIVGAEVTVGVGGSAGSGSSGGAGGAIVPLRPSYEHGVVALDRPLAVNGVVVEPGSLLYLDPGAEALELSVEGDRPARAFLLGGEPLEEALLMWWNFVARSHEEIVQAREDWAAGRRFGPVAGDDDAPLPAPPIPAVRLRPRPRTG